MSDRGRTSKAVTLWVLIALGPVYSALLHFRQTITGAALADGIIGVALGLYISSRPAANLIDLLFYRQASSRLFPSIRSALLWVAMNMLTLLSGWLSIFIGTTRLIVRGA
jgi:hypothetical protein